MTQGVELETVAVRAGRATDPTTGAVSLPVHLSATFEREPDGSFRAGFFYGRTGNPTRLALEQCLAALEGGAVAAAFASGQAATTAVFQALAPGDHVLVTAGFFATRRLLEEIFARWQLAATFVDTGDIETVKASLRPTTRLLWVETPTNPMLVVSDVAALAVLAHDHGVRLVCDNTVATPVLQRPLALGADLVMHSTTKYLGGHGDVVGGAIVSRQDDELFERVRTAQTLGGAVPSPFDCWLVLRGIATLPYRVRAHSANALAVATRLSCHEEVEAVHYPGLTSHPRHAIARRQMTQFGGLLSIQVRGGRARAMEVAARVRLFTRATSLGDTHSLIEHRASIESPTTVPDNLLRLSIGLEHADDLIADLEGALV